ncbi:MAG TPA: GGDEF domain-containing protein, partial [Actinoplanes sp.]|nr:GGDEF domain-containing protein [Actinoplanes sp.]
DGFKPVNDRHGHRAGDAVLRTVASRLAGAAADGDVVGRVGGDEFLVLRRGRGPEDLPTRAASLMRLPVDAGDAMVRVGVSCGSATARRGEAVDRDALIGRADAAMYAEKSAHRLQVA